MGLEELRYRVDYHTGTVALTLSPAPGTTWRYWRAGLVGLTAFMRGFETVEMTFVVRKRGEEAVLALGHLIYLRV